VDRLSIPAAIVLGATIAGALIATGLYLALRPPEGAPPRSSEAAREPYALRPDSSGPRPETLALTTVPPAGAQSPASPPASREEVAKAAAAAIEARRAEIVKKCWGRSPKDSSPQKYVFNFTFDAGGRQITRGVVEGPENRRPDVTRCMLETLPSLTLHAIGAVTYVEVPFSLP
jgi:hypothetical protein